jgi:hypothetical protein
MTLAGLSRRRFIGATSGVAAAATLVNFSGATAASADTHIRKKAMSKNGWPVLDDATSYTIEGSGREVSLAEGDAATILLHVAGDSTTRSTPCGLVTFTVGSAAAR